MEEIINPMSILTNGMGINLYTANPDGIKTNRYMNW
jgi:hypothetical protein